MKDFLVLLHVTKRDLNSHSNPGGKGYRVYITSWMNGLFSKGLLISGDLLRDDIVFLNCKAKATNEELRENNLVIGGYLLIKAVSMTKATSIAETCPILEFGGKVEVREILNLNW